MVNISNVSGIDFISFPNANINSVLIACYFQVGSVFETKGNRGITHLVEHMFFRRLYDLSQKELYRDIMKIGGDLGGTTYYDYVRFRLKISPKHLNSAIEIIKKFFNEFDWTEEEILAEKQVVKNQILYQTNNDYFHHLYFKGTKLDYAIAGKIEHIDNLTSKQINEWKRKYFTNGDVCVVMVGNFQQLDLYSLQKELTCNRTYKSRIAQNDNFFPKSFGRRTREDDIVISSGCDISDVCICFDIDEHKLDIHCVSILCEILGVGYGSRISNRVCDELALTDKVISRIYTDAGVSRLLIEYSVDNKDLIISLNEIVNEIIQIKEDVIQQDINEVIEYFTTNQYMNLDDCEHLAEQLYFNAIKYKQADITPQEKAEVYSQIDYLQVRNTAKKLFKPSNMSVFAYNNSRICPKKMLIEKLCRLREKMH